MPIASAPGDRDVVTVDASWYWSGDVIPAGDWRMPAVHDAGVVPGTDWKYPAWTRYQPATGAS